MSKKISLFTLLAMVLVLAAASWAFAAQNVQFNGSDNGFNDFAATKGLTADGNSTYPGEIYLPNEQDPAAYRIHSNYTSTTDACASCHSTHTGVGEALLQWGSVYDTCMACHDGTVTTTYNVADGKIGATGTRTAAGLFGHGSENSLSNHNVTGSLSVYAAPGGPGTAGATLSAPWDAEFECASCHSPHGQGGNARLLAPDVNGVATAAYNNGTTKNISLISDGNNQYHTDFDGDKINDTWLAAGHGYSDKVALFDGAGTKLASSAYTISNASGATVVTIDPANAQGPFKANFIAAVKVQMQVSNYLQANESVKQISGLNNFCSACHVDYNTSKVSGPDSNLNGTYTEAYRHKVGFDRTKSLAVLAPLNMKLEAAADGKNYVTCETCHVAHGTDQAYWEASLKAANNGVLPAGIAAEQLVEAAGSSALKRLPNMGTCEACHAKGAASQGYGVVTPVSNVTSNSPGGGYVGMNACANSHGSMYEHYNETWHPQISRPGLTQNQAAMAGSQPDTELDEIVPGLAQAIRDTQVELAKVGFTSEGRIKLDASDWIGKGVDQSKVTVWSTGTDTGSEIMVRGSLITVNNLPAALQASFNPDKWYIVADIEDDKIAEAEAEDATCISRGCHTTGYVIGQNGIQGNGTDQTLWFKAAAGGKKLPFQLGVTCEACHGQASNHVKAPSANNIVNPANFTTRVQSVGLQVDGKGGWAGIYDATKAYMDFFTDNNGNKVGNAMACGKCHSSASHQADFFTKTAVNPVTGKNALYWPDVAGANAHFLGAEDGIDSGVTIAGCNTCHDSHKESADVNQMKLPTIAQTCQQSGCHSTRGNLLPDGSRNGITRNPTNDAKILHNFPANH